MKRAIAPFRRVHKNHLIDLLIELRLMQEHARTRTEGSEAQAAEAIMSFSKFKAYLRKVSERTIRTLYRRVGAFVPTLSRTECRNYFRHAGYVSI